MNEQPEIPPDAFKVEADMDYDECLGLCESLGLLEVCQHGEHHYGRITQKGKNVMSALLRMAMHSTDPENRLKAT